MCSVIIIASLLVVIWLLIPLPRPFFGIYQRPGPWYFLKATFIYCVLNLRKYQNASKKSTQGNFFYKWDNGKYNMLVFYAAGYGVKTEKNIKEMETAQPLTDNAMAVDAVLLSCGGKDGSYLVAAIARRQLSMTNTIFCVRIPDIGTLVHPKHPDTTMFTGTKRGLNYHFLPLCTPFSDTDVTWESEGLRIQVKEPMKKWTVSYSGPMLHQQTKEQYQVNLKVLYRLRPK